MKVMITVSVTLIPSLCTLLNLTGSPDELLKELKSLVELLVHLEPSIVRTLATKPQVNGLLQCVISIYYKQPIHATEVSY